MMPPNVATVELASLTWPMIARAAKVSPIPSANTTDECPSENQKPTDSGRLPSLISLRVVLSIAEMWSASKAWRRPSVYAVTATPMPRSLECCGRIARMKTPQPTT